MGVIYDRRLTDAWADEYLRLVDEIADAYVGLDACQDATKRSINDIYSLVKTSRSWLIVNENQVQVRRVSRERSDAPGLIIKRFLELYGY